MIRGYVIETSDSPDIMILFVGSIMTKESVSS